MLTCRPAITSLSIAGIVCSALLIACSSESTRQASTNSSATNAPQETAQESAGASDAPTSTPSWLLTLPEISSQGDWDIVQSADELVNESPIIVIGKVVRTSEVINLARDMSDHRKPDPSIFVLGQVYEIEVEAYLHGEGPGSIQVVQREGFAYARDGGTIAQRLSAEEVELIKQASLRNGEHLPMTTGGRYVFFLGDLGSGFESFEYLTGATGIPWRLKVLEGGQLVPESPSVEANKRVQSMTLPQLEAMIQRETIVQ